MTVVVAALTLSFAMGLAVSGCGDDSSSSGSNEGSAEVPSADSEATEAAGSVLEQFMSASVDGDASTACSLLTADDRDYIENEKVDGCEGMVADLGVIYEGSAVRDVFLADGNDEEAVGLLEGPDGDLGERARVILQLENGEWRVAISS